MAITATIFARVTTIHSNEKKYLFNGTKQHACVIGNLPKLSHLFWGDLDIDSSLNEEKTKQGSFSVCFIDI